MKTTAFEQVVNERAYQWGRAALVGLLLLTGCKGDNGATGLQSSSAAARGSATATASFEPVVVRLDGVEVARLGPERLGPRAPIASLVDGISAAGKSWTGVIAVSSDNMRRFAIDDFPKTFGSHSLELFVDDQGRPCVGVFRQIAEGALEHVRAFHLKPKRLIVDVGIVELHREALPPMATERDPLTITIGGVTTKLSSKQLHGLPLTPAFVSRAEGGKGHNRNWHLQDVVATQLAPAEVKTVRVINAQGDAVELTGDSLADTKRRPLLRYNRNGVLILERWSEGNSKPDAKLRNVVRLEVVAR